VSDRTDSFIFWALILWLLSLK